MARFIDEHQYVKNVAFDFEEKLNSQFTRLMDLNPQPTTYYTISDVDSTVDDGLYAIERPLGSHSPLRYKRIEGLPIYMDDQVLLDLSDNEEGITTSYDADGKILPGTVIPYPDDYFYIHYLGKRFIFRVTEVAYDTIKSFNYYKINFAIKSVDSPDAYDDLERQTVARYHCLLRNIGTDERWIVEEDEFAAIQMLGKAYDIISDMYLNLYYHSTYNALLYEDTERGISIYDRYMSRFANRNELFERRFDYDTTILIEIDCDRRFEMDYGQSLYRQLELRRVRDIKNVPYILKTIQDPLSVFRLYGDLRVQSVYLLRGGTMGSYYLPIDFIPGGNKLPPLAPVIEEKKEEKNLQEEIASYSAPEAAPGNMVFPTAAEEPVVHEDNDASGTDDREIEERKEENPPEPITQTEEGGEIPIREESQQTPTSVGDTDLQEEAIKDVEIQDFQEDSEMDHQPDELDVLSKEDIHKDPWDALPANERVIRRFFNGEADSIKKLPLNELLDLDFLQYDWETFVGTPILLYALKRIYKDFMKAQEN